MSAESAQNSQTGFFSFDLPNFPTFKHAARQHRTATLIFFLLGYSLIVFSLIAVIFINQQLGERAPVRASQELPLATAYGSQRHVFTQVDGTVLAVYLNENGQIVAATSQDEGGNWEERVEPLVSEPAVNVSGALDKEGSLHLAYETKGKIFYRKVAASNWSVSEGVALDTSRLGHRPAIILDETSQLPLVAWSSEWRGTPLRGVQILFLAAKADPTNLANWCNAQETACGVGAFYFMSGSADSLGRRASYSVFHPVLVQMPQSGDLYLWWTEIFPSGKSTLFLLVGKKEGSGWSWGEVFKEDQLQSETAKNFTLSAISNKEQNEVVVAYINQGGQAKTVAYSKDKQKREFGPLGPIGDQFSLTESEGKYYLFYRNLDGRVGIRKFDSSVSSPAWSREIWQSSKAGGHPSSFHGPAAQKLPFIYVTPENKVEKTVYDLTPPTPTPTLEVSPTAFPSPTLEPSPEATPTVEPTVTPTAGPTLTPTSTPEAIPTATPT